MVAKFSSAKKTTKPKFLAKMEERKQHRQRLTHEKVSIARAREERRKEEVKKRSIEEEIKYLRSVVDNEIQSIRRLNSSHPVLLSYDNEMTFRARSLRDVFQYQLIYHGLDGFNTDWFKRGVHTLRFSFFNSKTDQEHAVGYALTEEVLLDRYAREYVFKDVVRWLNHDIEKIYKNSF